MRLYPPAWAIGQSLVDCDWGRVVPGGVGTTEPYVSIMTSVTILSRRVSSPNVGPKKKPSGPSFLIFHSAADRVAASVKALRMEGILLLATLAQQWHAPGAASGVA
jgi:hypothetical protein